MASETREFQQRYSELKQEHIRALKSGDVEAMERIQAELAELLKHQNGQEGPKG